MPSSTSIALTEREREEIGRATLDWVLNYFTAASEPPIYPTVGAPE